MYNEKPFRVAARSEREILLRLPESLQKSPAQTAILVKPLEPRRNIDTRVVVSWAVAYGRRETDASESHIPVRVVNPTAQAVTVPALTPLAELDVECEVPTKELEALDLEERAKVLREVTIDPNEVLSSDELEQVRVVVARRYRAFAQDPATPGATHAMTISLPLKEGAVPHRHAPPRLGADARRFVDKHTAELERAGVIYKTNNSAWSSRIVLVKKKDGSLRMCVDYRDTNRALQIMDSPLPRADQCLQAMSEGMYGEPEPTNETPEDREKKS